MTDDELDRALLSLPLAEPPPGLRARILAATVGAGPVPLPFAAVRPWDVYLGAAVFAVIVAATVWCFAFAPQVHVGEAFVDALRSLGLFKVSTYAWIAAGLSSVWAISSLPLMPSGPRTVYNR
jgi:hypothetical protein